MEKADQKVFAAMLYVMSLLLLITSKYIKVILRL